MKKIFTLILSASFALTASAQDDGFYRVKNTHTGRYLSVEDTNKDNYSVSVSSASVNVAGIRTKQWDYAVTSPATVIYLRKISGNNYDIEGQATSLYQLSGNRLTVTMNAQSDGTYIFTGTGTASGTTLTVTMHDNDEIDADESDCFIWADNKHSNAKNWNLIPIDTDKNYIGIEANVKTDDGYWGSIYAGFPFDLASDGMTAYYINSISGDGFTLEKISGTIPAATPVIIKCNSNDPSKNMIKPLTSGGSSISNNQLQGVYCALYAAHHMNYKQYDKSHHRVLGSNNGKIAFVKATSDDLYKGSYLKANRAFLYVPAGSPDTYVEGGTGITTIKAQEVKSEGMYSLTGARIQESSTPKAGIYIQNGKKIVIK